MIVTTQKHIYQESPAFMNVNQKLLKTQENTIQKQAAKADAYSFFNLLTSSKLLSVIEAQKTRVKTRVENTRKHAKTRVRYEWHLLKPKQ